MMIYWKHMRRIAGTALVTVLAAACTLTPTASPTPIVSTAAKPAATVSAPPSASPASSAPSPAAAKPGPVAPVGKPGGMVGEDYFAGKTIEAIVNYSPGGPTDTFARMLIQHLPKYIPGKPTVIVRNMPGAGGNIGTQHLYSAAKKDGLTLGILTAGAVEQLVNPERVQFDMTKFAWLGGVIETQVSYVRSDLGITSAAELPKVSGKVVVGGLSADSNKDLGERLFLNMLGVKYGYVTGYPGNNDVRAALLRNEVNFFEESLTGWFTAIRPLVDSKTVVQMAQRGVYRAGKFTRDARIQDIPTMEEVAVQLKGESVKQGLDYRGLVTVIQASLLSRSIVSPPGTPTDVVETLRKAVTDTFNDPAFQESASKQLSYKFEGISGAESAELNTAAVQQAMKDQETLNYVRVLAKEEG